MAPLKEIRCEGVEPEAVGAWWPMSKERATGIQAWLKAYREGSWSKTIIPTEVKGIEFLGPPFRRICAEISDQIIGLKKGEFIEIEIPDIFDASLHQARVECSEENSYQAKIEIGKMAELKWGGTILQVSQGMVELLSLPGEFIEAVKAYNYGLLFTITSRWFEMTTDPAKTNFLEIARLKGERRNHGKKPLAIVLETITGLAGRKRVLQKGGPIFVVDRDAHPPFERTGLVLDGRLLLDKEKFQREEEKRYFDEFCRINGIVDWRLKFFLGEAASFYREQLHFPHAKTSHYDDLVRVMVAACEQRIIHPWDFGEMKDKLKRGRGRPSDFWTLGVIENFITWLREEHLPQAFQGPELT